jgi:hypothetical protein
VQASGVAEGKSVQNCSLVPISEIPPAKISRLMAASDAVDGSFTGA